MVFGFLRRIGRGIARGARTVFNTARRVARPILGVARRGINLVRGGVRAIRRIPVVGQLAEPVVGAVDSVARTADNVVRTGERGLGAADTIARRLNIDR
jgi:hypothetical protein